MASSAPHRAISNELLAVSVRIKREAGVSHSQIQAVIDQFAAQEHWQERTGGIGFPLVEDIPQDRRAEFMAALAELAAPSDRKDGDSGSGRTVSVTEIWPSRIA